jgi:hypothetical protein
MSIPQSYIDRAVTKIQEINSWFQQEAVANPSAVLSLVSQRSSKIEQEIYAMFRNDRRGDYERERDDNTLHLSCRAGRGRPFGSVPTDTSSGVIERDNSNWVNVPEENHVDIHSSVAGDQSIDISPDKSRVNFEVRCTGVAFENTERGSGWHDATLHAIFRYTPSAIENIVNLEIVDLGHIVGV